MACFNRLIVCIFLGTGLTGCLSFGGNKGAGGTASSQGDKAGDPGLEASDSGSKSSTAGSEEFAIPSTSEHDDKTVTRGDLHRIDLKQAKLWARIDELEDELKRTRERMRVLERGLVLGLVPPEIQNEHAGIKKPTALEVDSESKPLPKKNNSKGAKPTIKGGAKDDATELSLAPDEEGPKASRGKTSNLAPEKETDYQKRLAIAQDHFRGGRYGRAIAEYSALGKDYGDRIEGGAHKYWVALSWYHLKEYQTSYNHFMEFLTEFPMSSLVPRAKLDLGRVEVRMGLKEKAMARFKEIMRDFPYEDAAEMARMEAANLEKNL